MALIIPSLDEIARSARPSSLADSDIALTLSNGFNLFMDPSTTRTVNLPTTGILKGDDILFTNLALAQKVIIKGSAGATLMTFQGGSVRLIALQNVPTTPAHWRITSVSGGASPTFRTYLSGNQSLTAVAAKVLWNTEVFDNNANYDKDTDHRFQPTVPGSFLLESKILISGTSNVGTYNLRVYKNGAQIDLVYFHALAVQGAWLQSLTIAALVEANGTTDYFEVFADDTDGSDSINTSSGQPSNFHGHRVGN